MHYMLFTMAFIDAYYKTHGYVVISHTFKMTELVNYIFKVSLHCSCFPKAL